MKRFADLEEKEVLALAISLEEEDQRIYEDFAASLEEAHPESSKVFLGMAAEEDGHRHRLLALYKKRFGDHIPLIRRQDVKGFVQRKPLWLSRPINLEKILQASEIMEQETRLFYRHARDLVADTDLRQLLGDLASEEIAHQKKLHSLEAEHAPGPVREQEKQNARRLFVMRIIQPGLAGLMDGSVSTLAPVFAAALATQNSWQTFLIAIAAAVGGGISMGFAEALSDDGSLTGRGSPWMRGFVCGLMTAAGGLGHALPFLIGDFAVAMIVAIIVVIVELGVIAWIRNHYMDTPFGSAVLQVGLGGSLVFAAGLLIGGA